MDSGPPSVNGPTSITLASANLPYIAYSAYDAIKCACYTGATWDFVTIDTGGSPSIAIGSSNTPHVSYIYGHDMWYRDVKHAYYNGSSWVTEVLASGDFSYASITLDSYEQAHISYIDDVGDNLKYAYFNGSSWDISNIDGYSYVSWFTSIAIDSDNSVHVGYHDSYDNFDLKYAYFNGSSWNIATVDSAGIVGRYGSIAIDSVDRPHICYSDDTNGNVKYAYFDGLLWKTETIDSEGNVGEYPCIKLDSNDRPHVSYHDVTNSDLKYAWRD